MKTQTPQQPTQQLLVHRPRCPLRAVQGVPEVLVLSHRHRQRRSGRRSRTTQRPARLIRRLPWRRMLRVARGMQRQR